MKKSDLFTRQRQSVFAIILILIKMLRIFVRQLWPVLIVVFVGRGENTQTWVILLTVTIGLLSISASLISYFKFYFFIKGDQLYIERGLLKRTRLNLPFDRIQTIDFEQNVVHQLFNVVRVKIDTAGSKSEEISFDALEKDRANALRDYILAQKAEMASEDVVDDDLALAETPEVILRLTPKDLIKIGISQNHFRTAGIIFAAAWALLDNLGQILETNLIDRAEEEVSTMVAGSVIILLIAIPVFLFISFLITLIRTVINYYDLRFMKTRNGFKLVSGLLTRKEKSAQKNKIQIIAWRTNPIMKVFNIFRLNLYQASSVEVLGGKSIAVPGCFQHHVDRSIESVIPGASEASFEFHGIHPLARFRFFLFAGLLPCALAVGGFWLVEQTFNWWLLVYLPFAGWMAYLYHKKRFLKLHPDLIISGKGIFGSKYQIFETYKIQAVRLSQSFYQWRKDLATVTMYTASGDISIPFIPMAKAAELRDYLLYRIERDGRNWM